MVDLKKKLNPVDFQLLLKKVFGNFFIASAI